MTKVKIGKELPIVAVVWKDATAYEAWDEAHGVELSEQYSVGMLVEQNEEKIVLVRTGSLGGEAQAFEGRLAIPAGTVIRLERLGTSPVPRPKEEAAGRQ